jgi:hypothetical protein
LVGVSRKFIWRQKSGSFPRSFEGEITHFVLNPFPYAQGFPLSRLRINFHRK